jgi:small-conductance mechanosensitive channel
MRKLQIIWASMLVISGVAATLGFMNVHAGDASGFCPWFWWMGIFTWDDALIIGAFLFMATAVVALKRSAVLTILTYSFYGVVRTAIEALYNLNAQFSPITRPWEANLPEFAAHFHLKLVELFVVAQVFYTVLCVAFSMVFISSLKRYLRN